MTNPNRELSAWEIGSCRECLCRANGVPDNASAGWPGARDWVAFCVNDKCVNHAGEEVYDQDEPGWVIENADVTAPHDQQRSGR